MERLVEVLRQQENDRDNVFADIIDKFIELRGADISMREFLEKPEKEISQRAIDTRNRLASSIKDGIMSGRYRVGSKLDTKALALRYDSNPATISLALNILKDEGLVERKQRSGTVVLRSSPQV